MIDWNHENRPFSLAATEQEGILTSISLACHQRVRGIPLVRSHNLPRLMLAVHCLRIVRRYH